MNYGKPTIFLPLIMFYEFAFSFSLFFIIIILYALRAKQRKETSEYKYDT